MKLRAGRLCGETGPGDIVEDPCNEHVADPYAELERAMSPVFSRVAAVRYLGGLISVGRLANLDSEGLGPEGRIKLGRKVGYIRGPFIAWLRARDKASGKPKIKSSKA